MSNHRTAAIGAPAVALLLSATLVGCDAVEWGGAQLDLEPPPSPPDTVEAEPETEPRLPPLPRGPLLFYARLGEGGRVLLSPVARTTDRGLEALELPRDVPEQWWARFDSTFLSPGRELMMEADGRRIGTAVIDSAGSRRQGCPPVATGTVLVPPGATLPTEAFARDRDPDGRSLGSLRPTGTTRRMRLFGPILAERLLGEAGEERPYLARRAALRAVELPGDTTPGMAATYLVNDTLAAGPPSGPASSLVFMAARDTAANYQPVWSLVRRYGPEGEKAAFEFVTWLRRPGASAGETVAAGDATYVLRRFDARSVRLAAGTARGDGSLEITWVEGDRCPVVRQLPSGP